ncbi:hypothetical protein BC936DRAFT_145590 [Jimgerdemannia flammicorona]|uniref:Uncharacterized protein n=1 Tax=Jimgerdemannia flammicorona TaxID=994334 RepID=A0A433D9L9_9FUNG|nr:hypothetical protein BC936DRAFT_145590 [Jimgerdemannia flammicorona]
MKFTSLITSSVLLIAAFLAQDAETSPIEKRVPSCYDGGKITFTQYWIPKEGTKDMDNNGNPLTLTGPKTEALKTGNGDLIADVDKNTYDKCHMEGTCLVDGGKLVNLVDSNTYEVVSASQFPWGLGNWDNALEPFVSVASNDWPRGSTAVVKELIGRKLPNGKVHNGCVRVDDKGWSFGSCQFDFFVLEFEWYSQMNLPEKVTATQQDCSIGNYVTNDMKQWMGQGGTTKTTKTKNLETSTKKHTKTTTKSKHHGWNHNGAVPTDAVAAEITNSEFTTTTTDAPERNFKVRPTHKPTMTHSGKSHSGKSHSGKSHSKTRSHSPIKTNHH